MCRNSGSQSWRAFSAAQAVTVDGISEVGGLGGGELRDAGEGHAGLGQGLDPDEVDDGLGAVSAGRM